MPRVAPMNIIELQKQVCKKHQMPVCPPQVGVPVALNTLHKRLFAALG